jgi:hypothetical protein
MDIHRNTKGRQASRSHWLRFVHVPERQDCDKELIPKESTSDWLTEERKDATV